MGNSHDSNEPVAWPCVIAEADFEKDTITLEMQCSDYMVRAGQHWLSTSPQSKPWVGLELHEVRHLKFKSDQDWMATRDQELRPEWADVFARAIEAKLRERNEHREKNA